jgi:predicted RNA-binding Zn-ribbon protein involved in translation (DUF1610 family)
MIEFLCPKCNAVMVLNESKTLELFSRELGYKVLEGGDIDIATLQDYLAYTCPACGTIKKYTLKEVEFHTRRYIAHKALTLRAIKMFKHLPEEAKTYDSKMFYCGKCAGIIDEEGRSGWCLENLAKYCSIYQGLKL